MTPRDHQFELIEALLILAWPGVLVLVWPILTGIVRAVRRRLPPWSKETWRIIAVATGILLFAGLTFGVIDYYSPRHDFGPTAPRRFHILVASGVSIVAAICFIPLRLVLGGVRHEKRYPIVWLLMMAGSLAWLGVAIYLFRDPSFLKPRDIFSFLVLCVFWTALGPAPSAFLMALSAYPRRRATNAVLNEPGN